MMKDTSQGEAENGNLFLVLILSKSIIIHVLVVVKPRHVQPTYAETAVQANYLAIAPGQHDLFIMNNFII